MGHPRLVAVDMDGGPDGAYVPERMSAQFFDTMAVYYHRIERVNSLDGVLDRLFKFGTDRAEGFADEHVEELAARLDGVMTPVTSGHTSMDLIIPGCHKASGLMRLLDRWHIDPADCAAFGDSGNDLELLRLVGQGYAMANASGAVLAAAPHRAPANDADGVLEVLDGWFGQRAG